MRDLQETEKHKTMNTKLTLLLLLLSINIFAQKDINSSLFGGSDNEYTFDHCFDEDGNVLVLGVIRGADIYLTDTLNLPFDQNNKNVLVRKYSPDFSALLSSIIIGGSGHDYSKGIAIDSQGNVFIGGSTKSSDFPTTDNAYQQSTNSVGESEAYIIKLNPEMNIILACTYFGGEDKDNVYDLNIDSDDNIFITGSSKSTTGIATAGAYDESYNGTSGGLFEFGDEFVAKFDNNLENLLAASYIGSPGDEAGYSFIINNENQIILTGATDHGSYPTTENVYQSNYKGGMDAFITIVNNDLSSIISSTFIGGSAYDIGWDITYDEANSNYIIVGETKSANYPTTSGVVSEHIGDSENGMISILSGDLHNLLASTYIGGNAWWDLLTGVDCTNQEIIFGGMTDALDVPTTDDAYFPDFMGGVGDAYFGTIDKNLTAYNYLTYIGGNNDDQIWGVSANDGEIYINGTTYSNDFESDSTFQGASDAFISFQTGLSVSIYQAPEFENIFSFSPNPVKNTLYIDAFESNTKELQIFDILGKIILTKPLNTNNKQISVDVSELKDGVYFISIDDQTQKFIKN